MKVLITSLLIFVSYCPFCQVDPLLDTAEIKLVYKQMDSIYTAYENEEFIEVVRLHESAKKSTYYQGLKLLIAVSNSFQVLANDEGSEEFREEHDKWYSLGVKHYGEELMKTGYDTDIYTIVEDPPNAIGGFKEFEAYIEQEARYPPSALEERIRGRVFVKFIVSPKGEIVAPNVIKGIGEPYDQEAIRLLQEGPSWKPGYQEGEAVYMMMIQNIYFDSKSYKKRLKEMNRN